MQRKTIILCAAGTGGHLFPAQRLAEELAGEYELLFVGKNLKTNPYFNNGRFLCKEVNAATFSIKRPLSVIKAACAIGQGFLQSRAILKKEKPLLLIGFGSFFSLPLLLAARWLKIPIILHEQNLLPGRVNRFFARFSLCVASTFSDTKNYLKGAVEQVQFPQKYSSGAIGKEQAACYFGLESNVRTLLVFGGSQGAKYLNHLAKEIVIALPKEEWQVIHFIGQGEEPKSYQEYYESHSIKAVVKSFEKEMDKAYALADLVLSRSGACTVNELLDATLPALLIPFPYATDDHQTKNGDFFATVVGGGWCYQQSSVNKEEVIELIKSSTKEMLLAKKKKMQEYKAKQEGKLLSLASLVKKYV